ncbi:hypothetical protein LCGC14_0846430 [marine sediment metagenome]|uniref:Uncharacterized protein n=1 Tax=marine sediment metagenome TaxID=412755 RepID=A0A0F9PBF6_9ZZZZ
MAEENKDAYVKTKELSTDEVKGIISTDFGTKIVLKDIKSGYHLIMKILEPVKIEKYDYDGGSQTKYMFKCKYKGKGIKPFELQVQAGENAVKRLQEKYPDDKYVDMYAFFSRTSHKGLYPQFINPIPHYNEPVDKDDLFNPTNENLPDNQAATTEEGEAKSLLSSPLELSEKEQQVITELEPFKGKPEFTPEAIRQSFLTRIPDLQEDRLKQLTARVLS